MQKERKRKGYAFQRYTMAKRKNLNHHSPYQKTKFVYKKSKKDMENIKPQWIWLLWRCRIWKNRKSAIRAAFKAVMDGKQSSIFSTNNSINKPTIFKFKQRMKEYPISVDLLNGFKNIKEQKSSKKTRR